MENLENKAKGSANCISSKYAVFSYNKVPLERIPIKTQSKVQFEGLCSQNDVSDDFLWKITLTNKAKKLFVWKFEWVIFHSKRN